MINYWATWCKPCIEELSGFIKLNKELKNKKFKMLLVTLDFPQHIEQRVIPFIRKNNIEAQVVLLDDDANIWITKVDKNWDGSIPVTQVIQNNKIKFYDKTLTQIERFAIANLLNRLRSCKVFILFVSPK
ncbi:MAG: redoxin domain-containing protein [Salinivirgaceae bacterium]|nr:redoxin domain-containing protein [Salinivirgaceae bacterium]